MKRFILTLCSMVMMLGIAVPVAHAQLELPDELRPFNSSTIGTVGSGEDRVIEVVGRVLTILLSLAGVVAVFFIGNSAFAMVISAGEEDKMTEAKRSLTWAIVGLVILLFAYAIVRLVIGVALQAEPEAGDLPAFLLNSGLSLWS